MKIRNLSPSRSIVALERFSLGYFLSAEDGGEVQWCFSQVKGTLDEDLTEGKILKFFKSSGYLR